MKKFLSMILAAILVVSSLSIAVFADGLQLMQVVGNIDYSCDFTTTSDSTKWVDNNSESALTLTSTPNGVSLTGKSPKYNQLLGMDYEITGTVYLLGENKYYGTEGYKIAKDVYFKSDFAKVDEQNVQTYILYHSANSVRTTLKEFTEFTDWCDSGSNCDFTFKVENGTKLTITYKVDTGAEKTGTVDDLPALMNKKVADADATASSLFDDYKFMMWAREDACLKDISIQTPGKEQKAIAELTELVSMDFTTAEGLTNWGSFEGDTFTQTTMTPNSTYGVTNSTLTYNSELPDVYKVKVYYKTDMTTDGNANDTGQYLKICLGDNLFLNLGYGNLDTQKNAWGYGNAYNKYSTDVYENIMYVKTMNVELTVNRLTGDITVQYSGVSNQDKDLTRNLGPFTLNVNDVKEGGSLDGKLSVMAGYLADCGIVKVDVTTPGDMFAATGTYSDGKYVGTITSDVDKLKDVTYIVGIYKGDVLVGVDVVEFNGINTSFEAVNTTELTPDKANLFVFDGMDTIAPYVNAVPLTITSGS